MKKFLERLLIRVFTYGIIFLWFCFAVPSLWEQGSSYALEFLFSFSVLFIFFIFKLEIFLSDDKKKNK